ncbi:MAG: hypothetical protein IPL52_05250 [Flavobacteriales bacterium]|nr:hypothetical protein [Flavobacteriales bacterium]
MESEEEHASWLHYASELTLPMAEFVNKIMNDPALYAQTISGWSLNEPYSISTYGEFALFITPRLLETLAYLTAEHWITNEYGVCKDPVTTCERSCVNTGCIQPGDHSDCNFCDCINPAQLNVQADLAVALYHLAAAFNPPAQLLKDKADNIANYIKSHMHHWANTYSKVWNSTPDEDSNNYALYEDVAHGASTIQAPLASYSLFGSAPFTSDDMIQLANTFAHNIWDSSVGVFKNSVYGTTNGIGDDQRSCTGTIVANYNDNFYGTGEVFCWIPLFVYDENQPPNDIYSVVLRQAKLMLNDSEDALLPSDYCVVNTSSFTGVQPYYGLSEVVKAQWQRECVDLTLYNRDLIYDQDFAVKNVLTVDPAPPIGPDHITPITASFADPIITEPRFTVREGITSQFRAGAAVVWQPGFEAEYGSHVEAVIDPAGCEMIVHMGLQGSEAQANEDKRVPFPADAFARDQARLLAARVPPSPQTTMRLVPNPSVGLSTLEVSLYENAELRWDLLNGLGQRVASSSPMLLTAGTHALPVDAASLAPGTFVLSVWVNGLPEQLRLVLTEQ